jgi:N-acetylneuraminate lyase
VADGQIDSLAGIKFTSTHIMDFHLCKMFKNGQYDIIWGCDEALLSGLVVGAESAIGSTYNYAAPLYNMIIQAFEDRNWHEAERLQRKAVLMVNLLLKYGGTSSGKAFMKILGIDCGWFRSPMSPLNQKGMEDLKSDLEQIGFFDFCSKL